MGTLWSQLVGTEKGHFVTKSSEWEGRTGGASLVYIGAMCPSSKSSARISVGLTVTGGSSLAWRER